MRSLPHRIHVIGVGGAGMSALAKLLAGQGHHISGSDQRAGATVDFMADLGLAVWEGHRPEAVAEAELIVASSAVPDTDPEIVAARAAGIPVWRRPDLLAALTTAMPTIGPTGTHGKTTTTAMTVAALRAAGADPSFIIGGELTGFGTNAHLGRDDLLVLEVDEAFGTFEHVRLRGLIVTNVEADHLDHFGTAEMLEKSFLQVAGAVDGPVVACLDDPGAARLAKRVGAITYGTDPDADWSISRFEVDDGRARFRLAGPDRSVAVDLPRTGIHTARNAAGALALVASLGYDLAPAAAGLAGFTGVRRRFEPKGTIGGVRIIDDYAHHPTEVAATLREAAQQGARRVWAVFQPHLYSRTRDMYPEFGQALALADGVVVTDVYGSREEPMPGVTGRLVADAASAAGACVDYVAHRADVAGHVARKVQPGDLVVIMGAGDITLVATELALALESSEPARHRS